MLFNIKKLQNLLRQNNSLCKAHLQFHKKNIFSPSIKDTCFSRAFLLCGRENGDCSGLSVAKINFDPEKEKKKLIYYFRGNQQCKVKYFPNINNEQLAGFIAS